MQAAAKLGISITISQVGSDLPASGTATLLPIDRSKEWQPTVTLDEDGLLHQLQATLIQALDASTRINYLFHFRFFWNYLKSVIFAKDLLWVFSIKRS